MSITKEQIKDIGWALSVLRGLDRLGFAGDDAGPRLESATAGFKALVTGSEFVPHLSDARPSPEDIHQMAFEEGQPSDNGDGYLFTAEEFDLFCARLLDALGR